MAGQETEDQGRRMEAEEREAALGHEPLSDVFCPLSKNPTKRDKVLL